LGQILNPKNTYKEASPSLLPEGSAVSEEVANVET
jgi:hypothetical protein